MDGNWIKNAEYNYSFHVDKHTIGTMEIQPNAYKSKASITINGERYQLRRSGFWKSTIEISDSADRSVLKTVPKRWKSNSSTIEFGNKSYQISFRNNPLAEIAILDGDQLIVSYGLTVQNKKQCVKIVATEEAHYLLHFLVWYLFLPIATETLGDQYDFLMLLSL